MHEGVGGLGERQLGGQVARGLPARRALPPFLHGGLEAVEVMLGEEVPQRLLGLGGFGLGEKIGRRLPAGEPRAQEPDLGRDAGKVVLLGVEAQRAGVGAGRSRRGVRRGTGLRWLGPLEHEGARRGRLGGSEARGVGRGSRGEEAAGSGGRRRAELRGRDGAVPPGGVEGGDRNAERKPGQEGEAAQRHAGDLSAMARTESRRSVSG